MRRRFSGNTYLSFEQTEMAIRAQQINEWLDNGEMVLGQLCRDLPGYYEPISEALEPGVDSIRCLMADGSTWNIYGYQRAPVPPQTMFGDTPKTLEGQKP